MTITAPQPTPAHRAALNLHALSEPDRQWVLHALSGEQQAALQPLLQELEELGIPRDAHLARAIATAGPGEDREGAALQALDDSGVRRLALLLAGEPPRLAAALLSSRAWAWRDRLMSELPVQYAQAIEETMRLTAAAGALQAAVVAELAPALREKDGAQLPRATLWQSICRRLRGRGGRR